MKFKVSLADAAVVFAGALVIVGLAGYLLVKPVLRGDEVAGFAGRVASFVVAHDGKLPNDWAEFSSMDENEEA